MSQKFSNIVVRAGSCVYHVTKVVKKPAVLGSIVVVGALTRCALLDTVCDFLITQMSSSSSCRATSVDIPDPLSPPLPIVHRFWQVFRATFRILTERLYAGSS